MRCADKCQMTYGYQGDSDNSELNATHQFTYFYLAMHYSLPLPHQLNLHRINQPPVAPAIIRFKRGG